MFGKNQEISEYLTYGQMNLINDFRYNILQLAMWTRAYINAVASDFGSLEGNTKKLHTIPDQFYSSLKPYMGEVIARAFQDYVFRHILAITNLTDAFKAGNNEDVDRYIAESYQIADEFSEFLAKSNLYWSKAQWYQLFADYLRMTLDEIIAIFSKQYERGIEIYDSIQYHGLIMADYLSRGVISIINTGKTSCFNRECGKLVI